MRRNYKEVTNLKLLLTCDNLYYYIIFSVKSNVRTGNTDAGVVKHVTALTEELAIQWTDLAPVQTDGADGNVSKDPARIKRPTDHSAHSFALATPTTLICKSNKICSML